MFTGVLCVCSGVSAAVQSPPPPQMKKKGVKDKEEVLLKLEVSLDLVSLSVTVPEAVLEGVPNKVSQSWVLLIQV